MTTKITADVADTATQADMEVATANKFVTADKVNYALGVAKGWVYMNNTLSIILASHNVASVTDNGTGECNILWDVDFSSTNYVIAGTPISTSFRIVSTGALTAGSTPINIYRTDSNILVDNAFSVIAFGDQ